MVQTACEVHWFLVHKMCTAHPNPACKTTSPLQPLFIPKDVPVLPKGVFASRHLLSRKVKKVAFHSNKLFWYWWGSPSKYFQEDIVRFFWLLFWFCFLLFRLFCCCCCGLVLVLGFVCCLFLIKSTSVWWEERYCTDRSFLELPMLRWSGAIWRAGVLLGGISIPLNSANEAVKAGWPGGRPRLPRQIQVTALGVGFAMMLLVQGCKDIYGNISSKVSITSITTCLADLRELGQSRNVSGEGSPNRNVLLWKSKICGLESISTAVFQSHPNLSPRRWP